MAPRRVRVVAAVAARAAPHRILRPPAARPRAHSAREAPRSLGHLRESPPRLVLAPTGTLLLPEATRPEDPAHHKVAEQEEHDEDRQERDDDSGAEDVER